MVERHLKSLEVLWQKIQEVDIALPSKIEKEIGKAISNFRIPKIAFSKLYPEFKRVSINKDLPTKNGRINKIRYLYNPPANLVENYGRANLKNQSIFYATFLTPTAINELNPEEGDLVTLSRWKLLQPYEELLVYPIHKVQLNSSIKGLDFSGLFDKNRKNQLDLAYQKALAKFSKKEQKVIAARLKFMAKCFSKRISPDLNSHYVITATMANKILYEMFDGQVEAITYPSVKDPVEIENIALKPWVVQNKYALKEVTEYRIVENSDNIKNQEITGITEKFVGGKIIW